MLRRWPVPSRRNTATTSQKAQHGRPAHLYKEEGVSMGAAVCGRSSRCIDSVFLLYYVIREPITYMPHNLALGVGAIVAFIQASGVDPGKNTYYALSWPRSVILASSQRPSSPSLVMQARSCRRISNFSFLGVRPRPAIPSFRFWQCEGWGEIGLFPDPGLFRPCSRCFRMFISQKMNNQVATNADGEVDQDAAARWQTRPTRRMMIMMPLMSLWIGFLDAGRYLRSTGSRRPCSAPPRTMILTKHYRKVYDEEDAVRAGTGKLSAAPKRRKRSVGNASFAASRTPTAFSRQRQQEEAPPAGEGSGTRRRPESYAAKKNSDTGVRTSRSRSPAIAGASLLPRPGLSGPTHYGRQTARAGSL
ncbi:MAG: hypothetical protein ACLU3I_00485 [Acutalibacteraceae bacterium]